MPVQQLNVPPKSLYALEFPGYSKQQNTLPLSIAAMLGGHQKIKRNFLEGQKFELRYSPEDFFSHPLIGDTLDTSNFLLAVHKCTNIRTGEVIYKFEILGKITNTVRFRGLCDFQYTPPQNDPIVKLRQQIATLDPVLMDFQIPVSPESSCMFAPPQLSSVKHQLKYRFKQNSNIKVLDSHDGTQFVNTAHRDLTYFTQFDFGKDIDVPAGPTEKITNEMKKKTVSDITNILKPLFESRPIWSRMAITANAKITFDYSRTEFTNALAQIAYYVSLGPYRFLWIKYGVDPRLDKQLRVYQVLELRVKQVPKKLPKLSASRPNPLKEVELEDKEMNSNSYIYDGDSKSKKHYQLCDIAVPELQKLIHSIIGTSTMFSVSYFLS